MIIDILEQLLQETRKHSPEVYYKFKDIKTKYIDDPDIYVHFSNSFYDSKNQLINQIGINVKQNYSNPFGIYAYPIKNIYDFKRDANKAYIIKTKKLNRWLDNISDMPISEYTRCMNILQKKYFNNSNSDRVRFEKETEQLSNNKSYGGILFYMIIRMSQNNEINKNSKANIFQTNVWTKDLGYSGFADLGNSIIHPSEPHQAIWFSSKGYDVVNNIDNNIINIEQIEHIVKTFSTKKLIVFLNNHNNVCTDVLYKLIEFGKYDTIINILHDIDCDLNELLEYVINNNINQIVQPLIDYIYSKNKINNYHFLTLAIRNANLNVVKYILPYASENEITDAFTELLSSDMFNDDIFNAFLMSPKLKIYEIHIDRSLYLDTNIITKKLLDSDKYDGKFSSGDNKKFLLSLIDNNDIFNNKPQLRLKKVNYSRIKKKYDD